MGIPVDDLIAVEKGTQVPSLTFIRAFCGALAVEPQSVYPFSIHKATGDEAWPPSETDRAMEHVAELVAGFLQLTTTDQNSILKIVKEMTSKI